MDVLICVSKNDLNYVFDMAVLSVIKNFSLLNKLIIVSDYSQEAYEVISKLDIKNDADIVFFEDSFFLKENENNLSGWIKQQLIKLRIDKVCTTDEICIIGSDTVLLKEINEQDILSNNEPYLYFNRTLYPSVHLKYERARLRKMAEILKVEPKKSFLLGNFIMELFVFKCDYLKQLRTYLYELYGKDCFAKIAPKETDSIIDKLEFSEWCLYAIYLLDVLNLTPPTKLSTEKYMSHIHSENYLKRFDYDSKIAHFACKCLDEKAIKNKLIYLIGE